MGDMHDEFDGDVDRLVKSREILLKPAFHVKRYEGRLSAAPGSARLVCLAGSPAEGLTLCAPDHPGGESLMEARRCSAETPQTLLGGERVEPDASRSQSPVSSLIRPERAAANR